MSVRTGGFPGDLGEKGTELLARATYVYRRRTGTSSGPQKVTFEAIRMYVKWFGWRWGTEQDQLSKSVVFGQQSLVGPARDWDLDDVARCLVNGARASLDGSGDAPTASVPVDVLLPEELPLTLDEEETDLLKRSMHVSRRRNGGAIDLGGVILEALELYLKLFWRWYGEEPDELSKIAVHGQPDGKVAAQDSDEAAKRAVKGGGKCYSRGDCCKRTLGVKVSEKEIQAIEELGHERVEFLDPDSLLNGQRRLKAGPGGCTFLAIAPNRESRCRVYSNRPEVCRDFFCNRGPP